MLISAVMVSSVMSIALTGKTGGGKADRKMIAGEEARRLSQILADYVSADPTAASAALMTVPGGSTWGWTGGVSDSCPGPSPCYALQAGSHTLTGFLPGWFQAPPYSGSATYFVYYSGAGAPPWVNVTVNWTDP